MPQAAKVIEEARAAGARVLEQETQKAIAAAEQIMIKAREAAAQDHDRMLAELKREVGRLVVQATTAVTGKILTPEDQRRLAEETAKQARGVAMISNKQAKREAKQLFRLCLVNGLLDENRVRQVVQHVVAAGHRELSRHPRAFSAVGETRPRAAHGQRRERHALAGGFAGCHPSQSDAPVRSGTDHCRSLTSVVDRRNAHPGGQRCL